MFVLVLYATTNGQTRKIARHVADRLVALGHSVELLNAADAADLDPGVHDAVVLAGSVHAGRFQNSLAEAMRRHGVKLAAKPTLFLSVSLTAAGDVAEERA
ncbi:MAG: flavodoxin domain-containing protein, partial [Gemmobacter sp.]